MRASTAFFVGIGTVCLAITGGLAGGLVIGNIMSPPPPKHASGAARLKQPSQPVPAASPLPDAASTLAFTDPSIKAKAAGADQKEQQSQKTESSAAASPPAVTAASKSASTEETSKPADHPAARQPMQETQQAAPPNKASAPEDAEAKARTSDLKHAADRRRAERAQRWAARHGRDQHQDQNQDQNQNQNQDQAQDQNRSANADQQASDNRSRDRGTSASNYSYNYSSRRYRDDSRWRYRNAEREDDDRGPRYEADGPRIGFQPFQLFGPDD